MNKLPAPRDPRCNATRLVPLPQAFNQKAGSYSSCAIVQKRLASWLAEWLEPAALVGTLTGHEFGAGDGLFTHFLASHYSQLTATDISPQMVAHGKRRLPQVDWRIADAWWPRGQCIDRLFSASLLHWCKNPVPVLRRWRRIINRDGRMLHGFYVAPTLAEWQLMAGGYSPVNWRSPSQWESTFNAAGWVVLRSEAQTHVQQFDSTIALLRFFHRTGAITPRQMSIARLRRMIGDYHRKCAASASALAVTSTWTFFRIEAAGC